MSQEYANREAALEWAHRTASGATRESLDWVDIRIDPTKRPFVQTEEQEGERLFAHMPYPAFLPPPMAEASAQAQARGQVPLAEAMLLLFSRLEWLIQGRRLLWSPLSPVPGLLAYLVEAFGIERELHRSNAEVLARLAAQLPTWHPTRGTVDRAREILESTGDQEQARNLAYEQRDGDTPVTPKIRQEAMACRSEAWWAARCGVDSTPHYRIDGGFLKFQPPSGDAYVLRKEDVLIDWRDDTVPPRQLVRLLPAWCVVRLVFTETAKATGKKKKETTK